MHHTQVSIDSTGASALISSSPHNSPLSPAPSSPLSSPTVSSDRRTPNTKSDHSGSEPSDSPIRVDSGGLLPVQHTSSFTGSDAASSPAGLHPLHALQLPAARAAPGSPHRPTLHRLDSVDSVDSDDNAGSGPRVAVSVSMAGGSPGSALKLRRGVSRAPTEGEVEMEPDHTAGEPHRTKTQPTTDTAPSSQTHAPSAGPQQTRGTTASTTPAAGFSDPLPLFDESPGPRIGSPQDFLTIPMPLPLPVSPLQQGHAMGRVGSPSVGGSVLFYPNSPSPRVRYATYGETRKRPSKVTPARSGALFGAGHLVSCCLLLLGATLFVLSVAYQSFYFRRLCDSGVNRCAEQRIGLLKICTAVASPANGPYSEEVCEDLSAAPDYSSNSGFQLVNKQFALLVSAAALAFTAGLLAGLRGLCKRCPSRSPLSRWTALLANLGAVSAVTLGLCGVLLHGETAVELGGQHSACAGAAGLCSVSVRLGWVSTVSFVALAVVIGGWATLAATTAAVIGSRWHDGYENGPKFP